MPAPSARLSSGVRSWLASNASADKRDLRERLAPHTCILIVLLLNLAFYAKAAPTLRLVELTVCREYYQQHDISRIQPGGFIDESDCKLPEIQKKVAWLFTADELLHFCCDFLATIPLGILAKRHGPKPVMLLNFTGLILSWAWLLIVCFFYHVFRSEMVLIASVFCLFGGATHFNTAIIYSEAAIYAEDRTAVFSRLELAIQIGQLTGPTIGSSLLLFGVSQPFYFVFASSLLSIPLVLSLPPANQKDGRQKRRSSDQGDALGHADEREGLLSDSISSQSTAINRSTNLREAIETTRVEFARCWNLFAEWKVIQYGYAASLVVTLGKQALHILLQYASKRFGITIAEAGFLFSVKAIVVIVLYLVIIPGVQRSLGGGHVDVAIKLARGSIILLAVGVTLMGLAWTIAVLIPGLVIYALGFGFPIAVRSLLSSLATTHDLPIPVMFSGMAIAETAGSFIGATVLTDAFTRTLEHDGWIRGMPFFICSVFYLAILLPTWFLHLKGDFTSRSTPGPTDEHS